jgi:hypothetical protein
MSMSQDHFLRRESLALAAIALGLLVCAVLLTIGLLLAGYGLADVTSWFVRATGG